MGTAALSIALVFLPNPFLDCRNTDVNYSRFFFQKCLWIVITLRCFAHPPSQRSRPSQRLWYISLGKAPPGDYARSGDNLLWRRGVLDFLDVAIHPTGMGGRCLRIREYPRPERVDLWHGVSVGGSGV